jgi:predicted nuclease of predicted toxin-antitoxin system
MTEAPTSRFLADINISPRTVEALSLQGWNIVRVSAFQMSKSPDVDILELARREGFFIITEDLDFSKLLAMNGLSQPSLITVRLSRSDPETTTQKLQELAQDHPDLDHELANGVAITIDDRGTRFHRLPIKR